MTQIKQQAVTIRDVARRAGLSIATVSRYINHTLPVSDEAARQVQEAMDALHFVPSSAARKLASQKSFTLGMMISDMRSDFFGPMLHGIEDIASQAGFDLLISTSRRAVRGGNYPVGPNNTDGLLVFSDGMDDETLARFCESGFPIVLIHRKPPAGLNVPSVNVENTTSSQRIVEHLIQEHHRSKIVLLRGPESQSDSYERELGYRTALEAHNLPYDPDLVQPGEFDRAVAQGSIDDLLRQNVDFDAVFSGDDEAAIGVLVALQEAGKMVPQEVAVVGFDDQNMSAFLHPALTTVRAPTVDVGRIAAEKLIDLIHTGKTEPAVTLPTEIILRRSCGCR